MSRSRGLVSVVAALALAVTLIGCTDADDLASGNFTLKLVPQATNLAGVDYECITMDFGVVRLVPLDPDAADALGSSPQIAVVPVSQNSVGFQETQNCSGFLTQSLPDVPLPSGQYVFDRLSFGQIFLDDGVTQSFCSFEVNYLDAAASPVIEIGPTGANTISITMDVDAVATDAFDNFCVNFFFDPLSFVTIEAI